MDRYVQLSFFVHVWGYEEIDMDEKEKELVGTEQKHTQNCKRSHGMATVNTLHKKEYWKSHAFTANCIILAQKHYP